MRTQIFGAIAILFAVTSTAQAKQKLTDDEAKQVASAVSEVCPLLEQEAGLIDMIKEERANPADVVNLRRLHELGELIAVTRAQLRDVRAEQKAGLALFRKGFGAPLSAEWCSKYWTEE